MLSHPNHGGRGEMKLLNKIIVVDNISGVGGLTAVANLYFLSPF